MRIICHLSPRLSGDLSLTISITAVAGRQRDIGALKLPWSGCHHRHHHHLLRTAVAHTWWRRSGGRDPGRRWGTLYQPLGLERAQREQPEVALASSPGLFSVLHVSRARKRKGTGTRLEVARVLLHAAARAAFTSRSCHSPRRSSGNLVFSHFLLT